MVRNDDNHNDGFVLEGVVKLVAQEVLDNKGEDVVVLDVRRLSSLADYFVITHGRSTKHVQGMADNLLANLKKKGIRSLGVEGEREGKWVLIDYGEVVVHLFYGPVREFYDLEGLWSQAPRMDLGSGDQGPTK